ncbi:MAG: hypothetical protein BMS9Abin23_0687 [Thermodesulfobacteriota bacterium]|nr:MAG: hypothetical protein BMS9Abin23_0687 [Thermodesulfobacteriota bacterium]
MKISHRFNLYVGGVLFIGLLILGYMNYMEHDSLLKKIGLNEAQRLGNAVFSELYTSMMLGGGRKLDRAVIKRYKGIDGVEDIRIIHGKIIDRDYGTESDETPLDELDLRGLKGETVYSIEKTAGGRKAVRFIMPVRIEQGCTRCHDAPTGTVGGAVSITVSLERYRAIIGRHMDNMVLWGGGLLMLVSLTGLFAVRRRFLAPLKKLEVGLGALSRGDLAHRVDLKTGDEVEDLGTAFNNMAQSLHTANATLGEMNEKYAMLVEMAADAIVVIEAETMRFVEANMAATVLTGYTKEELSGMRAPDLYPEEMRPEYISRFKRWVFDGKGYLHDIACRKKDGSLVPVDVSASLLEINGKRLIQEIWRDISERKGFEEKLRRQIEGLEERVRERTAELNKSYEELDEAYKKLKVSQSQIIRSAKLVSLGEMGAGIAHELNSPLAGILSIVEVLMMRLDKGDRNYYLLEKIKDAAVRSKFIILDMLTYARPFRGEYSPVFINSVIRSTLSLFVSEVKTTAIEITLDLDPEIPAVMGSKGQLMEVVFNIVKNARDVLGGHGSITITSRPADEGGSNKVVVEVRDSGPGIPAEIKDRIFDPFFSTKDKGGGKNVGLGLSLSQSIVEEHGGSIEVENIKGGGACFRIVLPAAPEREEEED